MTITQHQMAIIAENEKLRQQNEIMKQIATADGFYDFYFKQICNFESRIEAFDYTNDLYKKYFGTIRYSNYWSFKRNFNKKLNQR